jgi:NADPH-dependent 2,4-dienoyl-CoA reductase/sulfur reductase-like enzyme/rhodanese-related sulfurtransferase
VIGVKVVIVGGVAGGMSAATRLRRLDEQAQIVVLEKGPYVSFANCGLPYYISGEIGNRDDLIVESPAELQARFNLDVRPEHTVTKIDPVTQTVSGTTSGGRSFTESYDKLILAPGAKPLVPDIHGLADAANAFVLRSIPDLDRIMLTLHQVQPKQALIIGAGFIGLEVAENLRRRGLAVTIVEQTPHVLPPLDEEMAAFVQQELQAHNVRVITGQSVTTLQDDGHTAQLSDGTTLSTDLTILSVGVRPNTDVAGAAGIKLGLRGGIVVDDHYQTSQPNIYAVGDAIVVTQQITGQPALIPLASPANRQGRQVADVIAGLPQRNRGSIGTAIVRVFDLAAASTGLSERAARQAGLDVAVIHVLGKNHAAYYPEATPINLKLIFNPHTGEIYGAQGVGVDGVDKRIDVLATAIKGHLTVADLPELELTYAPPFGSAKDPVNMLGYAALNITEGLSTHIQWYQLPDALKNGAILLDVRDPDEIAEGHFPHSVNIPLNDLRDRLNELDPKQPYIVSCRSGQRAYIAERILRQHGFQVKNLDGAYQLYQAVRPNDLVYPK